MYQRNVRLYFICQFLRFFYLVQAISMLYYQKLGVSYTGLGLLWLALSLTQIVFEIPSGMLSDRFGRKRVIAIGYAAYCATHLFIGLADGFFLLFVSCVFWGISEAMLSGALDAFMYDTLKAEKREAQYMRIQGYHETMTSISIVMASIIGAHIYESHPRGIWFMSAILVGVAALLFLFTKEPKVEGETQVGGTKEQLKQAMGFVKSKPVVFWYMIFFCMMQIPFYGIIIVRQPFMLSEGFRVIELGYVFAGIQVLSSLTGFLTHRIEKKLGKKASLVLAGLFPIPVYFTMSQVSGWGVPLCFVFVYGSFTFQAIILNTYVNELIPSNQRATIISMRSFVSAGFQIVFISSIGVILDLVAIQVFLLILTGYFVICAILLWGLAKRIRVGASL